MSRILYKYLDIVGAKCMIGNRNLQFTNASQLNDPFDCHPKLIDYSNVPDTKLQGWIPKKLWIEKEENDALNLRNDTWLCSLSKVNNSLLMWSHYCYNHKGVCIGLDIDKVMEYVPPMFGTIYLEPLILDVQYQDIIERPNAYNSANDRFIARLSSILRSRLRSNLPIRFCAVNSGIHTVQSLILSGEV